MKKVVIAVKGIFSGIALVALTVTGVMFVVSSASATNNTNDAACVPVEAVAYKPEVTKKVSNADAKNAVPEVSHLEYQRYSFVRDKSDHTPPSTTPPSDEWNPDNKKNPKGDPIGEAFQRGSGNGSYFFWTSTKIIDTVAQDAVKETFRTVVVTEEIQAVEAVSCKSADPSTGIGEPACGPIDSCGEVPTYVDENPEPVVTVVSQCTDDYDGTFRTITITEVDGDSVWVFDDTYRDECFWVETTPKPVVNLAPAEAPAKAANPVVAEVTFAG